MDGRTDWHCFVRLDLLVPKGRVVCGRNSVVECQLPKLNVVGSNPIARFFRIFVVVKPLWQIQSGLFVLAFAASLVFGYINHHFRFCRTRADFFPYLLTYVFHSPLSNRSGSIKAWQDEQFLRYKTSPAFISLLCMVLTVSGS